jgi:hypothetical protein
MSIESHINQLEDRHRSLETRLHDLSVSPSATDSEVKSIKQRKLRLKDEISRLQSGS